MPTVEAEPLVSAFKREVAKMRTGSIEIEISDARVC